MACETLQHGGIMGLCERVRVRRRHLAAGRPTGNSSAGGRTAGGASTPTASKGSPGHGSLALVVSVARMIALGRLAPVAAPRPSEQPITLLVAQAFHLWCRSRRST